jgi:hypothetical protein
MYAGAGERDGAQGVGGAGGGVPAGNIEEKASKRVEFGEEVELLGRLVNAREGKVSLPREKRFNYLAHAAVVKGCLEWGGVGREEMAKVVTTESM